MPEAKSKLADFTEGTRFRRLIPDESDIPDGQMVENLVFCSGKIFYELVKARKEANLVGKIAIARIEQVRTVTTFVSKKFQLLVLTLDQSVPL